MATSANYLVLGAAGGIGTELCQQLVSAGHRVMMCGRNGEKLQNLAQQLGQPSMTVEASDWEAVAMLLVASAAQEHPGPWKAAEGDWLTEVRSADGHLVAKCSAEEARLIVGAEAKYRQVASYGRAGRRG